MAMPANDEASNPRGVLVAAESVSGDGDVQGYAEVVVTLEGQTIDIRTGDRKGTVWMVSLAEIEEALRLLKRWRRT